MITYQVRIQVDIEVEAQWIHWMKSVHVPDVIATGLLTSYHILKPQEENQVYYFHYQFPDQAAFEQYQKDFAPKLKADVQEAFPGRSSATRQLLDWI
ncbi:MAG: DUF4286 family protein [Saprospiraceae bacterium]|nr:DUF4286 family protein [Saprospiraceae bacterium]